MNIIRYCLFCIFVSFGNTYEDGNIITDGWRPLSKYEALYRISPNVQQVNDIGIRNIDYFWNPANPPDSVQESKDDVIKEIKPQVLEKFADYEESSLHSKERKFEIKPNALSKRTNIPNCAEADVDESVERHDVNGLERNDYETHNNVFENNRKAKKIVDNDDKVINKFVQNQKELDTQDEASIKQEARSSTHDFVKYGNSYEVTEKGNPGVINSEQSTLQRSGYYYKPPEFVGKQTNFTNKFLDILSKYNINTNEEFRNYELSRVPNRQSSFNPEFIYLPIPVRALGVNRVNPIIAVFLSNFGYEPGLYPNTYRNLNRYPSSNNILNKKPFSLYKVYSDTDSSSK